LVNQNKLHIFVETIKHMGTYIYTYKKKLDKNAILDGKEVKVGEATFLCKKDWSGNYTPQEKREMTRATCLLEHNQPDYITFGDEVYKNNKLGIWSDGSGFWTGIDYKNDYVGKLEKIGKKYFIKYLAN
jgi:hypothetical protein